MAEPKIEKKEFLEEEIDISFFIQFVEVEGNYNEYYKLYGRIKDAKSEDEISFSYLNPEEMKFRKILEQIEKLYDVYKNAGNQKLAEGAKEEILKLVALILWNINH